MRQRKWEASTRKRTRKSSVKTSADSTTTMVDSWGLEGSFCAKRAKLWRPANLRGGLLHGVDVERVFDPPDVPLVEGGLAGGYLVEVGAGGGVVAGVEVGGGLFDVEDGDVGGEALVPLVLQQGGLVAGVAAVGLAELDVGHLAEGVHAGVGAAGAHDLDGRLEKILDGAPERTGDGAGVLLFLPAAVLGPVVFQRDFPGLHPYPVIMNSV